MTEKNTQPEGAEHIDADEWHSIHGGCVKCGRSEAEHPVDVDGPGAGQQMLCATYSPLAEPDGPAIEDAGRAWPKWEGEGDEPMWWKRHPQYGECDNFDDPGCAQCRDMIQEAHSGLVAYELEIARLRSTPGERIEGCLRDPDLWAVEYVDLTRHIDDPIWHCDEADALGEASERVTDEHADWVAMGKDGDEPKESDYTVVGVWIGNPTCSAGTQPNE